MTIAKISSLEEAVGIINQSGNPTDLFILTTVKHDQLTVTIKYHQGILDTTTITDPITKEVMSHIQDDLKSGSNMHIPHAIPYADGEITIYGTGSFNKNKLTIEFTDFVDSAGRTPHYSDRLYVLRCWGFHVATHYTVPAVEVVKNIEVLKQSLPYIKGIFVTKDVQELFVGIVPLCPFYFHW